MMFPLFVELASRAGFFVVGQCLVEDWWAIPLMLGGVYDFALRSDAPPVRSEVDSHHRVTSHSLELWERGGHRSRGFGALELRRFRGRESLRNPRDEQVVVGNPHQALSFGGRFWCFNMGRCHKVLK